MELTVRELIHYLMELPLDEKVKIEIKNEDSVTTLEKISLNHYVGRYVALGCE